MNMQPHVLREYALLADGERGAILGPRGDITWLCAPHWHSPSIFAALLGGESVCAVTPRGRFVWGGFYERGSLIWHSRWVTEHGVTECREALAFPGDPHRAVLLRRVHAVDGPADVDVVLRPRGDYDRERPTELHGRGGVWTMRCAGLYLRWTCGAGARVHDAELRQRLTLDAGDRHDLVLEISDRPLPDEPIGPDDAWRTTETAWESAIGQAYDAATGHSVAVLTGLTSHTGGMVAAATTGLPERSDAGRNYDYRYVWIRDQCFAGHAAVAVGALSLLDSAVRFVTARLLDDGDRMTPAYTTLGEPLPDEHRLQLPGYPGGSDIAGNRAGKQFQLDAFGESLLLLAEARRLGRLDDAGQQAIQVAADAIGRRWGEPDAGIWELESRAWTHSRLIAVAGLRAAARESDARSGSPWLALADRILADTTEHALHADGHWQRSPDDPSLDAALLLPALRGAVEPDDPRAQATLRAVLGKLTDDGYAYRFRHDERPLADAEGSFLLCGFLVALALDADGQREEARAWFERTRMATGPPQLFSEEYDAVQQQMRGNLPQAFVHALMIETAARFGKTAG
jgi:hypothetical protein